MNNWIKFHKTEYNFYEKLFYNIFAFLFIIQSLISFVALYVIFTRQENGVFLSIIVIFLIISFSEMSVFTAYIVYFFKKRKKKRQKEEDSKLLIK